MDDWNGSVPAWDLEEAIERLRRPPAPRAPHSARSASAML